MTFSRRSFLGAVGAGGASVLPLFAARGSEALTAAVRAAQLQGLDPEAAATRLQLAAQGKLRLDTNENPRGISSAAQEAVRKTVSLAGRYPVELTDNLRTMIAAVNSVDREYVLLGSGSTEVLRMAVSAFVSPQKHLVAAEPSYEDAPYYAQLMGAKIDFVPLTQNLTVDLQKMLTAARGAGIVYLSNPANPTGTLLGADGIASFVRNIRRESRDTIVLIDEAYHEYVEDTSHRSAVALAAENDNVIVARTFSKAYGMAGLRVGYAVARPEVIGTLQPQKLIHGVNMLGAAAATGCLADSSYLSSERKANREARDFTQRWFESAGYKVSRSHTNFIMVDIRRDALNFQLTCSELGVLVGRPFPPLNSQTRISIGSMDEMQRATEVFRRVLAR